MWYLRNIAYPGVPAEMTYGGVQWTPHPKQLLLLEATEDVVGFGGSAGGGKSDGSLGKGIKRCEAEPGTQCVVFRKLYADAVKPGAIWSRAQQLTIPAGWTPKNMALHHPYNGSALTVSHLKNPTSYLSWQGSEVDMFLFDELTHFTAEEFHYLRSRLRDSDEGVSRRKQVVFTTNPESEHWVKDLLAPWVDDQHEMYPLSPDVVLHVEMGDTPEDVIHHLEPPDDPNIETFSLRFIPSSLDDNPSLGQDYHKQLSSLPKVFRDALLKGDWNIVISAGMYFKLENLQTQAFGDDPIVLSVRYWDTAGSVKQVESGDYMVGLRIRRHESRRYNIDHVNRGKIHVSQMKSTILAQAEIDGPGVVVGIEHEGGSESGGWVLEVRRELQEMEIKSIVLRPVADKGKRCMPLAAAAEQGVVAVGEGKWRRPLVNEMLRFPDVDHDDQIDAASGAFAIASQPLGNYTYFSTSMA